jgi:hypothetical protein
MSTKYYYSSSLTTCCGLSPFKKYTTDHVLEKLKSAYWCCPDHGYSLIPDYYMKELGISDPSNEGEIIKKIKCSKKELSCPIIYNNSSSVIVDNKIVI